MFDSGVKVSKLIESLKNEVDIALDIPDETYLEWLNALQRLLYTEIIREQAVCEIPSGEITPDIIVLSDLSGLFGDTVRFEDIYAVYKGSVQLIKTTLTSGAVFSNCFYKTESGNMGYKTDSVGNMRIIYCIKPEIIEMTTATVENEAIAVIPSNVNVMLPYEFLDLVKAKLRGEAYKLANEDTLAAKWLNDYNILLETFKAWIDTKAPQFGM